MDQWTSSLFVLLLAYRHSKGPPSHGTVWKSKTKLQLRSVCRSVVSSLPSNAQETKLESLLLNLFELRIAKGPQGQALFKRLRWTILLE